MATTSRETVRDALVALLETALVGAGLPVKTVVGSKQDSLIGIWPLVAVLSAGSAREALTFSGNIAAFNFNVQVYVRQSDTSWTHAQAEDALDDIEARIAEVYEDEMFNRPTWEVLQYSADTTVVEAAIEGVPFYIENIPTVAKMVVN